MQSYLSARNDHVTLFGRIIRFASLLLLFFVTQTLDCHAERKISSTLALRKTYDDLRNLLDTAFPGRGTTDYPGHTIDDVPKGYAMILKAEILTGLTENIGLSSLAKTSGYFLMKHSDERNDGFPGWGVPIAWDPYGDGSINVRNTKYTISTAIVVDALLDWIASDRTAPREEVLKLVRGSLLPYLKKQILSPSGLFPYSLEPTDRKYDTFNPAAYLAGVLQRYSVMESDPRTKARMRKFADATVSALIRHRRLSAAGTWFWNYSVTEPVPNDLAHAAYVIYGLQTYVENKGALAVRLDIPAISRHLADFIEPVTGQILAWPNFRTDANTPARAYDLGMGLYLACKNVSPDLRSPFLSMLPAYRTRGGAYLKYPPGRGLETFPVREYEAYVLFGLASCIALHE